MKKNIVFIIFSILIFGSLLSALIGSIINMKIIMVIGLIGLVISVIMVPLRGLIKPFACAMGWHAYSYDVTGYDGASMHAKCPWCKYEGMIDSQGNLF